MEPIILQHPDQHALHAFDVLEDHIGNMLFQEGTAVEAGSLRGVIGAVLHEAHEARQVHLAVLGSQELLQVVVA